MKNNLPILALIVALSGCSGETTIDTTSARALNESVAEISEELEPVERKRFDAAIQTLIRANRGEGRTLDAIAMAMGPQAGGKTAAQVIVVAEAWSAAEEKRIAALKRQQELDELDSKIGEYTAEIARLQVVIVKQAAIVKKVLGEFDFPNRRYFWRESLAENYPIIDVEITNNHSKPIETVVIRGFLRRAGQPDPVVDGQLRYEFPAGLKPGGTQSMRFEPDVFGEWANPELKDRDDLELTVEVVNLTYPGGAELIRSDVFRGNDPVVKLKGLERRLNEAITQRNALLEQVNSANS